MKLKNVGVAVLTTMFVFGAACMQSANAATAVDLGSAANFAVLAGSTITNTGPTIINGDLGLSPGTSVTGFPPGILNGIQHVADAEALQAQTDLTTAYNDAAGQTPVSTIPTELGGSTLTTNVYDSTAGTFSITGTVTLDGENDPNAVFIFLTESTLITASSSSINLINGAQACNVFWQVGSSATLGSNSTFKGNILALTSSTLTISADVEGRILARNAAVTLDTNVITSPTCLSPQINVDKTADASVVTVGDEVTYTYEVTNPGDVGLTDVTVVDDMCSDVTFVSGDDNNNDRLGVAETWIYTCTMALTETTTNVATAEGVAIGVTVTDTDTVTVATETPTDQTPVDETPTDETPVDQTPVVDTPGESVGTPGTPSTPSLTKTPSASTVATTSTPGLPNTGIQPSERKMPWLPIAGVTIASIGLFVVRRKISSRTMRA